MTVTDTCGHHCGSQNGAERHCNCPECHDANLLPFRPEAGAVRGGVPMCERWATRARQWDTDHPAEMSPEERRDFEDEQIRGCRP
jgi:hypothetical protein